MIRRAGRPAAAWLLFCLLVVTAVGFVSTPVGAKSNERAPEGYHAVKMKSAGLSMAVPDAWLELDPSSPSFQRVVDEASEANPRLAPLLDQFSASAGEISYMAVDQANSSFVSNVLVTPTALSKATLSQPLLVKNGLQTALSAMKPSDLDVVKVNVGGKRSLVSTAKLTLASPDGTPVVAYSTSYFVPTKKGVVQVTFSTGTDGMHDETVQTMVDSVTIP